METEDKIQEILLVEDVMKGVIMQIIVKTEMKLLVLIVEKKDIQKEIAEVKRKRLNLKEMKEMEKEINI